MEDQLVRDDLSEAESHQEVLDDVEDREEAERDPVDILPCSRGS